MHAAVIAINEAIDRGQASMTMAALNNPNAMLRNTQEPLAQDYQDTLSQSKARKMSQSSGKVGNLKLFFDLLCLGVIILLYLIKFMNSFIHIELLITPLCAWSESLKRV